ncbi:MAG: hypothetical protein J6S73_00805 [Lentisphaeria bacterium]|nr:hypothetical protein [Lentisphaeria bacterium]
MEENFSEWWKMPPAAYRSRLFWAWNSRLEEAELRRQIGDMQAAGMGGFFMHSRIGLETPYLSEEWFRMVRVCIDEARKRGMNAELYDEDRWPSGSCGGQVAANPDFQMRFLCAAYADCNPRIDPERDKILARFAVRENHQYRKLSASGKLRAGERELLFVRRIAEPISWFNNQPPPDLMNRKTTLQFLRLTHEAYNKHCNEAFGKTVTGIFTDEPTYLYVNNVMNSDEPGYAGQPLPWTERFAWHFARRHHYSLIDHLPELWLPRSREDAGQVRRDFFDTAAHLLAENYFKPIGEWCRKHHIAFTGHILGEDNLAGQTARSGEVMRHYKYMQEPGIDILTNHAQYYLTAKQCASVAHQYGKKFRISETYGGGGWDLSLTAMKAIGDWQYALGINRRCLHLGWYSVKGERKRDFPLDFGSFSGNREPLAGLEDYFARLGVALTQGEECCKLLVIHPLEDFWRGYYGAAIESYASPDSAEDKPFAALIHQLLAEHLDFEFGCEDLLAVDGRVEPEGIFAGKACYQAVLVPEMTHLRESTRKLLRQFQAAGGSVFTLGDAYPEGIRISRDELAVRLSPLIRTFSVTGPDGKELPNILGNLRKDGRTRIFFVCNTGLAEIREPFHVPVAEKRVLVSPEAVIRIPSEPVRHVYLADPASGRMTEYPLEYQDGMVVLKCAFGKLESHLFFLTDDVFPAAVCAAPAKAGRTCPVRFAGARPEMCNALVLDHALLPTAGIAPDQPRFILELDTAFRGTCGLEAYNWRVVQPYLVPKPARSKAFELHYPFRIGTVPEGGLVLAHEFPEDHELFCNGVKLTRQAPAVFPGNGLQYLAIGAGSLRRGENRIIVKGLYDPADGMFEAMYLLGDFAVNANDELTPVPESIQPGDWRHQGFPYYSGSMTYTFEFTAEKAASGVRIGSLEAAAFAVSYRLNDGPETVPCTEPFAADVSGEVKPGKNILTVRIFSTRRNLMGPFYCRIKQVIAMPGHFRRVDAPDRETVPYGLNGAPPVELMD